MPRTRFMAAAMAVAAPLPAIAATAIDTGDSAGAYHSQFCPRLEAELGKAKLDYVCTPTSGTADNIERVAKNPAEIGYAQLDVFALETAGRGGDKAFTRIRADDVRECIFAVTRSREIGNFGDVAVHAPRLRAVIPPANSGSAGTFRFLQKIDPEGLAKVREVMITASPDEAIKTALAADDTIGFFVQFPDPDNARFRMIQELGGHIVPVLDRNILRQQIGAQKVYFAQDTQVASASWAKTGTTVTTACTPIVLFTGATAALGGDKAKQDHRDMIATVAAIKPEDLVPKESIYEKLLKRGRELSAVSVEALLKYSEDARAKAKPYLDQAREATERARDAAGKAIEAAKPAYDKAKEAAAKAYERAKEEAKELMEKSRPSETTPKP